MGKRGIFQGNEFNGMGIVQGWRAIGQCIGRSGRTARRWYDNYSLPVLHTPSGRPFALIDEITVFMLKFDEIVRNEYPELREKQRQHAAMMRSRKGMSKG